LSYRITNFEHVLQLSICLLQNVGHATTKNGLSSGQVLGLERDLSGAVRAFPDFPDARLELVSRLDGGGEAHAEELERRGVVASCSFDNCAGGEAKRREAVENDTSKAGTLTDFGVCESMGSSAGLQGNWLPTYQCEEGCSLH
jgi:hypothetical protein